MPETWAFTVDVREYRRVNCNGKIERVRAHPRRTRRWGKRPRP